MRLRRERCGTEPATWCWRIRWGCQRRDQRPTSPAGASRADVKVTLFVRAPIHSTRLIRSLRLPCASTRARVSRVRESHAEHRVRPSLHVRDSVLTCALVDVCCNGGGDSAKSCSSRERLGSNHAAQVGLEARSCTASLACCRRPPCCRGFMCRFAAATGSLCKMDRSVASAVISWISR